MPDHPGEDGETDHTAVVRDAVRQTVAADTVRIDYSVAFEWNLPQFPAPERRRPVRDAIGARGKSIAKAIGKRACRLATRRRDPRHQAAQGIIDFAGRRFMIDYGSYATIGIDAQEWSGRSGRPLNTLVVGTARVGSPLWLVDLLSGITGAEDRGTDDGAGQPRHHYTVTASAADAAAATSGQLPTPSQDRFEDLLALPLDVWLDDSGYLRRIRFGLRDQVYDLTLTDFGADADNLDWTRLPTSDPATDRGATTDRWE